MDQSPSVLPAQSAARELLEKAFERQRRRDFEGALDLYRRSVKLCPTAEAYCFMGWTHSFLGKYEEAIRCCRTAIEIDPELGNPYNDIGAYLIELKRPEEAIVWLKRATRAARYDCHHYPWYNLGKIYETQMQMDRARDCYARSLRVCRNYAPAAGALRRVLAELN